jgi:predicted nucleic acid-binding protein
MTSDQPTLFIDTWGWLALEDRREKEHPRVLSLRHAYGKRRAGWITTDYVLDETITRLFARRPWDEARRFCEGILRASDAGLVQIEAITQARFQEAYRLRIRLNDKPRISFTDLTSMCVMKERGLRHVVTSDRHFVQVGLGFVTVP